jgi:tetratricopeptide (TPR) repeat protein
MSNRPSRIDQVYEQLLQAPAGLHHWQAPSGAPPASAPTSLHELYVLIGAAELFHETLLIAPACDVSIADVSAVTQAGRQAQLWQFASIDGDTLAVASDGAVYQWDDTVDEFISIGSSLDNWLWGTIDAMQLRYDAEGEYLDDVFDDDGELCQDMVITQLKAQLKRDRKSVGLRWRLGTALVAKGDVKRGREELEACVDAAPDFYWAWLELARVSERLGEFAGAYDEASAAAQTAERLNAGPAMIGPAGYLWSCTARYASKAGQSALREAAASKVHALAPLMRSEQLTGLHQCIEQADFVSAQRLIELLRAVWPRDIEVLDGARKLEIAISAAPMTAVTHDDDTQYDDAGNDELDRQST